MELKQPIIDWSSVGCQYNNATNQLTIMYVAKVQNNKHIFTEIVKCNLDEAIDKYSKLNNKRVESGGSSEPMTYLEFKSNKESIKYNKYKITIK